MQRRAVLGFFIFMSILTTGYTLIPINQAQAIDTIRPKSDYENAVSRIEEFVDYAKTYASDSQYPQEYAYLNSLLLKTSVLVDRYDDKDFVNHNSEAYNIALTVIDDAITSCRYVFGIVRAENLATNPTPAPSAPSTTTSTNPTPATNNRPQPKAQANSTSSTESTAFSSTVATTTKTEVVQISDDSNSSVTSNISTFESTDSKTTNHNPEPIEVPNTGANLSSSSSIVFIVLVGLIAAIASTGIYFIYNYKAKPTTPVSRKKRH